MYKLTYKIVSYLQKTETHHNTRYYTFKKRKMSSKILPKLLRSFAEQYPEETIVCACLEDLEYISDFD